MTYQELKRVLTGSALFTAAETEKIVQSVGRATIGNSVIACELLGIELSGDDIDALYSVNQ